MNSRMNTWESSEIVIVQGRTSEEREELRGTGKYFGFNGVCVCSSRRNGWVCLYDRNLGM